MAERGQVAQRIHRVARSARVAGGRATSSLRSDPDFLVVGAQRAGTTALYKALAQHPAVVPAGLHKGVHYFDTHYARGHEWYRSHFPTRATLRRRGGTSGRAVTGEASPYYMFHPLAPERIARDLPDVRLVVMLRDPVERAYSAYTHERARGFEDQDFPTALALEPERLAGETDRVLADPSYVSTAHQHNAYVARGHYVDQLEELVRHVGRDRLCVVDSDELFDRHESGFAEVLAFLGLPGWMPDRFEQKNARPRSDLSPALRRELAEHFRDSDERLATWWGRTPSWCR